MFAVCVEVELSRLQLHACAWRTTGDAGVAVGAAAYELGHKVSGGWVTCASTAAAALSMSA
jgi:hypothetical protein